MNRVTIAAAFALFLSGDASAQIGFACVPRVAAGAALGLQTADIPVDPVLAGAGRFGLANTAGTGLDVSVRGNVPVTRAWSVRAESGAGSMAVVQERDASGEYVRRATGDDVTVRWLAVGLQHHAASRRLCGYGSVVAGVYRYSYRGVSLKVPGAAGAIGIEVPVRGSGAWFVELGLSVALTELSAPTAAELVVNVRPAVGWLFRF